MGGSPTARWTATEGGTGRNASSRGQPRRTTQGRRRIDSRGEPPLLLCVTRELLRVTQSSRGISPREQRRQRHRRGLHPEDPRPEAHHGPPRLQRRGTLLVREPAFWPNGG